MIIYDETAVHQTGSGEWIAVGPGLDIEPGLKMVIGVTDNSTPTGGAMPLNPSNAVSIDYSADGVSVIGPLWATSQQVVSTGALTRSGDGTLTFSSSDGDDTYMSQTLIPSGFIRATITADPGSGSQDITIYVA